MAVPAPSSMLDTSPSTPQVVSASAHSHHDDPKPQADAPWPLHHRSRRPCGRRRRASPPGFAGAVTAQAPATNLSRVSSHSFPRPFPAESVTGALEFGPAPPPSMAGATLRRIQYSRGLGAKRNSNSVVVFLIIEHCVENHRKIEKM
jgi:hypothetical protein